MHNDVKEVEDEDEDEDDTDDDNIINSSTQHTSCVLQVFRFFYTRKFEAKTIKSNARSGAHQTKIHFRIKSSSASASSSSYEM